MAASRRQRKNRPDVNWVIRGGIAIAVALAALWSLSLTAANIVVKADSDLAHMLAPADWIIAAKNAQDSFVASPTADPGSEPARIARQALLHEPTAVEALNVISLQDQLRGRAQDAKAVTRYGLRLSRRELRVHLSAIEEAVTIGDVSSALRHYDLALRTSSDANILLLRTLSAALIEPRIRDAMTVMVRKRPSWTMNFIDVAMGGERNPEGAALFFQDSRNADLPLTDEKRGKLVDALLQKRAYDQAWSYYTSFRKGVRRDSSRDTRFTSPVTETNPLEWRQGDEPALASALTPDRAGGAIILAAPAGIGGTVAAQTQLLRPGNYRLSGRYEGLGLKDSERPVWTVTCSDGAVIARIPVGGLAGNAGEYAGQFQVSAQCPLQVLALEIRPVVSTTGVSGTINSVAIRPIR